MEAVYMERIVLLALPEDLLELMRTLAHCHVAALTHAIDTYTERNVAQPPVCTNRLCDSNAQQSATDALHEATALTHYLDAIDYDTPLRKARARITTGAYVLDTHAYSDDDDDDDDKRVQIPCTD